MKSPILLSELASLQIIDISFNENHSVALTSLGKVYSWGFSLDGALGYTIEKENQSIPKEVVSLKSKQITKIITGKHNTAALT